MLDRATSFLRTQAQGGWEEWLTAAVGLQGGSARRMTEVVRRIDHIGFLLPPRTRADQLETVAAAAGLRVSASFASEVFCQELTHLNGGGRVPTRVFRLQGTGPEPSLAVEGFLAEAKPAVVANWVACGVGTHLAFQAVSLEALQEVRSLLAPRQDRIPAFLQGRPGWNAAQRTMVLYYDLPWPADGGRLRLEFCHASAEDANDGP